VNRLFAVATTVALLFSGAPARAATRDYSWDIAVINRALAQAKPGDKWIRFGDVGVRPEQLRSFRDRLAAMRDGKPLPKVITPAGSAFKWPGGTVPYRFDTTQVGNGTITTTKMQQFRDGVAEWAAFANLHFTEFTGTPPTNYITVSEFTTGGEGGFSSSVGMSGGEQLIQFGVHSWNRGTVCHEVGHALGLFHEQQRPDRDTYVMIHPENIDDNLEPNFAIISGGQTFGASYDFYSIMHYKRNDLSNNGQDTITMRPGFTQYIDVIGKVFDRTLSKIERAGMAAIYGNPSPLPSAVVTNTNDSGPGSLRTAIYFAFDRSTDAVPTPTTIVFHIPTSDPNYNSTTHVFSIRPTYLPVALGNGTTIDATSEATFLGTDINPLGPEIVLDGSNFAVLGREPFNLFSPGLILRAASCTVKGLTIQNFNERGIDMLAGSDPNGSVTTGNVVGGTTAATRNVISGNATYGIGIHDSTTANNTILGNYIGTDQTGNSAQANAVAGVVIYQAAHNNTVGGTAAGAGNVISGNTFHGIFIGDAGTNNNLVQGNFIGLNAAGNGAIANQTGVEITASSQANTIGGTTTGAANTISGNTFSGIAIDGTGTQNNLLQGNFIGVNHAIGHIGDAALPNGSAGINIFGGTQSNTIGGTAPGAGNLISGNGFQGISISGSNTNNNLVQGNVIGLNAAGNGKIQNLEGIAIFAGAQSNTIGGTNPAALNVISGNQFQGISIGGNNTNNNLVQGNYIGVDGNGSGSGLGNGGDGVGIFGDGPAPSPSPGPAPNTGAQFNTVGGLTGAARNIISNNGANGVEISNPGNNGTNNNLVVGNYIGTDKTGTIAKPNGAGVSIFGGARFNTIGGTTASARNVVSGNNFQGVVIGGVANTQGATMGPMQNLVQGNYVGLQKDGLTALGNASVGVDLNGAAQSNTVGGSSPGSGNVIAANAFHDLDIGGNNTNANVVAGNFIGLDKDGNNAIANNNNGVGIFSGAKNNIIGGTSPGARNFISGHAHYGVFISDSGTTGNLIQGNTIGLNVNGVARPNTNPGNFETAVGVFNGAQSNTIGGSALGASNIIADNTNEGVAIFDPTTIKNAISRNSIFGNHIRGIGMGSLYNNSNNNQASPGLSSAILGNSGNVGGTDVGGTLSGSAASTAFTIEFFANPAGNDEGQFFVGSASVMTNGSGTATFTSPPIHLIAAVPKNYLITATATDPNGNTSQFSSTQVVTATDSDGDGMPDNYEAANPGVTDPNADNDGDGLTNYEEMLAGTDPRSGANRFQITLTAGNGSDIQVTFRSVIGKTYRLEYRPDLIAGNWLTLADQIFATSTSTQVTDTGAHSLGKRYYRLVVVP
jgi:hypothetical protein